MSDSNGYVESEFSINKQMLIENLQQESLIARCLVYDARHHYGHTINKNVNSKMIRLCILLCFDIASYWHSWKTQWSLNHT